ELRVVQPPADQRGSAEGLVRSTRMRLEDGGREGRNGCVAVGAVTGRQVAEGRVIDVSGTVVRTVEIRVCRNEWLIERDVAREGAGKCPVARLYVDGRWQQARVGAVGETLDGIHLGVRIDIAIEAVEYQIARERRQIAVAGAVERHTGIA